MTNPNKAELRRLAEAATGGEWFNAGDLLWFDEKTGESHGLNVEDDRFIAAANPAAILALLGENDKRGAEIDRLRGRFAYWKQRAKSAEGHLFAGDVRAAAKALHSNTTQGLTKFEDLSEEDRHSRFRGAWSVLASVNSERRLRLPHDSRVDMVWCACGDGYPAYSFGAGFIAANNGICENCDAADQTREGSANG